MTNFILKLTSLTLLFWGGVGFAQDVEPFTSAQKKIENSCAQNFNAKNEFGRAFDNKSVTNICACVASNFVKLSKNEKSEENSLRLLYYVEKYYAKKLSRQQIDRDPFYIDEFFQEIGSSCIRNPSYQHSY